MTPNPGDVFIVDLGMVAKSRPMIIVSRVDPDPPRALVLCVPVTSQNRRSQYEVALGKPRFLRETSWANVQGLVAVEKVKLGKKLGRLSSTQINMLRNALRFALDL